MKLFFTPDEELYNKRIDEMFSKEVLDSNFWMYWRTMFAFENWHSALEMKLYIRRFIHHIGGLPDFKALRFTRYNQYESMILPMPKVGVAARSRSSHRAEARLIATSITAPTAPIKIPANTMAFKSTGLRVPRSAR